MNIQGIQFSYTTNKPAKVNSQTVENAKSVLNTLLQIGFKPSEFKDVKIEAPTVENNGHTHVFIRLNNNFEVVLKDSSLNVGFKSTSGKVKNWYDKLVSLTEINHTKWSNYENSRVEVECDSIQQAISISKKLLKLSYKLK
jgi:tRNA(Phe) wybutosine-synthesizing methylase Tyw3